MSSQPISIGKKRRGRPPGSKNKAKKRQAAANADDRFSEAFSHISPHEDSNRNREDEDLMEDDMVDDNFDVADSDDEPALYQGSLVDIGDKITEMINDNNELSENNKDSSEEIRIDDDRTAGCVGFGDSNLFSTQYLLDLFDVRKRSIEYEDELKGLKDACVADNSKKCYNGAICCLLMYYYKNQKSKLHKSWNQILETATFGMNEGVKKDTALRRTIQRMLTKVDTKVPPIDFDNYSAKEFMQYLLGLKKKKGNREETLSNATYANARSALFHLYRMYEKKQSDEFVNEISIMLRGLRRKLTKKNGEGNIHSGKTPLSYEMYRQINQWMLEECTSESIFGQTFLVLTWNLMCRSANTISIHLHHMEWHNDSLAIYFAHMKNDQGGEQKRDPRHTFANPIDPLVCPILTLGIYFSVFQLTGNKYTALFPGSNQYIRFTKYFHSVLDKHKDEWLYLFGCDVSEIGVHSIRKGAATYVSSGSTCAPPQVATNIRAGWTMGPIQDTYLRYESAGDQYVGRVVSGLPLSSAKFAALPPEITSIEKKHQDKIVKEMSPNLPASLNQVAKFIAGSLLYHFKYLKSILKPSHPFLLSSFCCCKEVSECCDKIKLRFAYEDPECQSSTLNSKEKDSDQDTARTIILEDENSMIQAGTGIPSHVLIIAKMERVILAQSTMLQKIRLVLSSELDKRELGQSNFLFKQEMKELLKNFTDKVHNDINKLPQVQEKVSITNESTVKTRKGSFSLFYWNNKYRRVPSDFIFPMKTSIASAWHRYFFGEPGNDIGPFRYITSGDLVKTKNARQKLNNYKTLMTFMEDTLKKAGKYKKEPTEDEAKVMLAYASPVIFGLSSNPRAEQFTWTTHAKYVYNYKKNLKM